MGNILAIDDDRHILEVVRTRLEAGGHHVETCDDPLEALERMKTKEFELVVSDIRMPSIDGVELVRRIRNLSWDIPVILLTAYGTIDNAVEAMKQGAFQYLTKPFQGKELLKQVELALAQRGQAPAESTCSNGTYFPGVYGVSEAMEAIFPLVQGMFSSEATVLIQGESGTGKELFARMIHHNGPRRDARFVVLDCGATPGSLIESELFGHSRGSFTSATETRQGLFEMANKGTLFMDEVGTLPLDLQTRLLRVLQEGQIKRVGENMMKKVDVRVIAATNTDLNEQVRNGQFRLDLYYRIAVLNLRLPPLRDRREDIPLLARHFLKNFSKKMNKAPMTFGPEVLEALDQHSWPGNIRELKNVIEAAVVFAREGSLTMNELQHAGFGSQPGAGSPGDVPNFDRNQHSLPEFLEGQERTLILDELQKNNWIQKKTADQLGISPRMLGYKIKKYKIDIPVA